jgi:hypothetical protein
MLILEFHSLSFSVSMVIAATRKSDMIKNCQGLNKTNWGFNAAMKQNCFMTYALEDCERELSKALPPTVATDFFLELGIVPSEEALAKADSFFDDLKETQTANLNVMSKALLHERQLYYVCQQKDMDYMRTYVGNQLINDETTKRMAFWDKVQNTKDNKQKQQANQGKSAKNASAAEFRKNRGQGQNNNGPSQQQQKPAQEAAAGSGKPWVQPWTNQNNNSSNYQKNDGGGGANKFNKSFTPKNCPSCLKPHHGNSPCD